MTEPITCHKGKCKYKKKQHINECINCDIVEQIEHDLLKDNIQQNTVNLSAHLTYAA